MKFTAKTLFGLEDVLARELEDLGADKIRIGNRAVIFSGNRELLYCVNYCSRLAISVLVSVDSFRIKTKDDLYSFSRKINWSSFMSTGSTFSVVPVVNSKIFTHTGYPALIVKDAIADQFRTRFGKRPSVDVADPDLVVNLHISNDLVNISLDSSVVPLFKRGYRKVQGTAPLNEVLAAGILKLSGWDSMTPIHDPMCGSGTIPVEAALMACNIPPGRYREHFGFQRWNDYDEELFMKVRGYRDAMISDMSVDISASDISEVAVEQALENIKGAGLQGYMRVERNDFRDTRGQHKKGFLVFNPPYGERLKPVEIDNLYATIGSTLKHNYPGYSAWMLTNGRQLLKNVGLKPKSRFTLFNGSLECTLAGFELYEGSRKMKGIDSP